MSAIQLYEHQIDALSRIKTGCVVCGGVGSGKSLTAISYYYLQNGGEIDSLNGGEYMPMDDPPMDLYIITTARKRDTLEWEKELAPFLISVGCNAGMYRHTVIIDSWNNIQKYIGVEHAFFIFDEQRVVGSGVWVKSFLKITRKNDWILLSATPGDTWTDYIPLFIANGFYRSKSEFQREHVIWSRYAQFPKVERFIGEKRLKYYRDQILVDMDFERPTESHHMDIWVGFDMAEYKTLIRTRYDPWKDQPMENASALCYCLRKCVNSDPTRQAALLEIFETHPRIIVFYSFDYELDILKALNYGKNVAVAEWNGHHHQPIPKTSKWVYLVQYNAGAEGWNCIETNTIVFFSQNYSYKVMVQASGRIDRLNTPFKDLYYYHIKSRSGIDLAISRALEQKKTFNENRFIKW